MTLLSSEELDDRFLQALKLPFQSKQIETAVHELGGSVETDDETTYLLKSPANREQLLTAIANVAKGENLLTIQVSDLFHSFRCRARQVPASLPSS